MGERERQETLDRFRALSEDDRSITVWEILGHPVRPWTEGQEIAALLGILQCPEGHQASMSHFYVDGRTHLVVDKDGHILPPGRRFENQDSFDVPSDPERTGLNLNGIYCEMCGAMKVAQAGFYVPDRVLKMLLFEP